MFDRKLKKAICSIAVFLFISFNLQVNCQGSGLEELMGKLPDDTIMFVGTSGTDELEGPFEKTILGQMWKDSSTQSFINQIQSELKGKFLRDVPSGNASSVIEQVLDTIQSAIKRPMVMGLAANKSNPTEPFYGFVIIETSGGQVEIAKQIFRLESLSEDIVEVQVSGHAMHSLRTGGAKKPYWGWVGSRFVLAVNDKEGLALKNLKGSEKGAVTDYLSKLEGAGDALAVYVDIQKLSDVIKKAAGEKEGSKEFIEVFKMFELIGLSDVKNVKARLGFSGENLVVDELVTVGPYRRGLFNHIRPVEQSLLNKVDSRAINVCSYNFNTAGAYDTILNAIEQTTPDEGYPEIVNAIQQIESQIHFGIRSEFLSSLAGPVLFYTMPTIPEANMPGGLAGIVKINDANSFEKSVRYLSEFAVAMSRGQAELSSQERDGRIYRSFLTAQGGVFQVEPTWTFVEDYVVFGMNFPLCRFAVEKMSAAGIKGTIGTTAGFQEARAAMPGSVVFFKYSDTRRQFERLTQVAGMYWPMANMLAGQAGIKLPASLPSLSGIAEKMGPSYGYGWFDGDGLRVRYKGVGLEQSIGAAAGASFATVGLMPALVKSRIAAQRVVSGNNLKLIGAALVAYNIDHEGGYPADLQALVAQGILPAKALESPRRPRDFEGPSYIYIPGQNQTMPPNNIIAYENPAFCPDGVNVLFNDAHVEFMKPEKFSEALQQTNERLQKVNEKEQTDSGL